MATDEVKLASRGPVAESRLHRLEDGRYEYLPKKGVSFVVSAEQLVRRLVSLVPPAKTHLTSFHGVSDQRRREEAGSAV